MKHSILILLVNFFFFRPALANAISLEEKLASHFNLTQVILYKAQTSLDFVQASYREYGPTVFVEIGHSKEIVVFYAELSDEGGIILTYRPRSSDIKIVLQDHNVTCSKIWIYFQQFSDFESVCDLKIYFTNLIK